MLRGDGGMAEIVAAKFDIMEIRRSHCYSALKRKTSLNHECHRFLSVR